MITRLWRATFDFRFGTAHNSGASVCYLRSDPRAAKAITRRAGADTERQHDGHRDDAIAVHAVLFKSRPSNIGSARFLQLILRHLHPLATFQCRLVRDDSCECHVQRFADVYDWFSV